MPRSHLFVLIPFTYNGNTGSEHTAVLGSKSCSNRPLSTHNLLMKKIHSDEEKKSCIITAEVSLIQIKQSSICQGQSDLLLSLVSKNVCLLSLDALWELQSRHLMFLFSLGRCLSLQFQSDRPAITLSGSPMAMDNLSKKNQIALATCFTYIFFFFFLNIKILKNTNA